MKNKHLMEAVDKAVQVIQGYSKEELEHELSKSKESNLANTVDELVAFPEYTGESENTQ